MGDDDLICIACSHPHAYHAAASMTIRKVLAHLYQSKIKKWRATPAAQGSHCGVRKPFLFDFVVLSPRNRATLFLAQALQARPGIRWTWNS
jgi:hypothetical protein